MKPGLYIGKTNERTCTLEVSAGDKVFAVENADVYFSVGDHIFVANSGETDVEYAGVVVQVSSGGVQVDKGVERDKGLNARIWKPTYYYQFYWREREQAVRDDLGIEIIESRGDTVWITKTSDAKRFVELRWDRYLASEYEQFKSFVIQRLNYGLETFTFVYRSQGEGNVVKRAKMVMTSLERRYADEGLAGGVSIRVQILGDGYVQ